MGDMLTIPAAGMLSGSSTALAAAPAPAVTGGPAFEQVLRGTVSSAPGLPQAEQREGAELGVVAQALLPAAAAPLSPSVAAPQTQGSRAGGAVMPFGRALPALSGGDPPSGADAWPPLAPPTSDGVSTHRQRIAVTAPPLGGQPQRFAGVGAMEATAEGMPPGGIAPRQLGIDEAPTISPAQSWMPAAVPSTARAWGAATADRPVPGSIEHRNLVAVDGGTAMLGGAAGQTAAALASDPAWLAATSRLVDAAMAARDEESRAAAAVPAATAGSAGAGLPGLDLMEAGQPQAMTPSASSDPVELYGSLAAGGTDGTPAAASDGGATNAAETELEDSHDSLRGPGQPALSGYAARAYDATMAAGADVPAQPVIPPDRPVSAPPARSDALLAAQATRLADLAAGFAPGRTVDQVAGALAVEVRDGRLEAVITLRPEALGEVRARISAGPDGVVVHLSAEHEAVGELLRSQLSDLRAALAGHQLAVADVHVLPNAPVATLPAAPEPNPWPGQEWPRARDERQDGDEHPGGGESREEEE